MGTSRSTGAGRGKGLAGVALVQAAMLVRLLCLHLQWCSQVEEQIMNTWLCLCSYLNLAWLTG